MDGTGNQTEVLLAAGWQALAAGAWEDARASFGAALEQEETAPALEGLGWASWWLNDVAATFGARERAYRRYRERGDDRAAGRIAVSLAADHFLRRGEHAVASGWFQRAHRLLDGLDPCPEHAMLAIWESYVAAVFAHDPATARRLGEQARATARALGAVDLEMLAQASLGYATVCAGEVAQGMRLLDEATAAAVAGEMTDPDAIVTTCCYLISACERVRDFERAAQWCERAIALATRWSYRFMFAYCRSHYAGVLLWRGAWPAAEAELAAATGELAATFPAMAAEGIARLAELRRRQGRVAEAQALLDRLDADPLRAMGSKLALLGRAALALDRGDPTAAVAFGERYLRGVPAQDRVERVAGLELVARAQLAQGDLGRGARTVAELEEIAAAIATPPLRAAANAAAGALAMAAAEHEEARRCFEDAIDLYTASGAPFEAASARLDLVPVLAALGRTAAAAEEARAALAVFAELGAAGERKRATLLLHRLAPGAAAELPSPPAPAPRLTPRELDILRLVARGLSDKEMASSLRLSEHTVHRHVANVLDKLDVPSRAAAVARAAHHGLL
jgi:DNA-binding NarL/FixJ family response regulator